MRKKIYSKAVTAIQMTVVLLAVFALAINGASAAQRLFDAYLAPQEVVKEANKSAQLLPGPPSPEEVPGNMTPGEPNSEAYAYLSAQPAIDSNHSQNRLRDEGSAVEVLTDALEGSADESLIKSTASLVSSQLGIQFTLVGAKPSGTS